MKPTVLVALATLEAANAAREVLRKAGYPVAAAVAAGDVAVRKCVELTPHVALIDPSLPPPVTGIEAARQIQTRSRTAVVFVGEQFDPVILEQTEPLRPAGYLTLPLPPPALEPTLSVAAFRHRKSASADGHDLLLRQSFEQADIALVTTDVTGSVALINAAAEELTGWPACEAVGRDYLQLLPTFDPETLHPTECDATRGSDGSGTFLLVKSRRDEYVPVLMNLSALTRPDGKMNGLCFAFRRFDPLDDLRGLRRELAVLQKKLAETPRETVAAPAGGPRQDRLDAIQSALGRAVLQLTPLVTEVCGGVGIIAHEARAAGLAALDANAAQWQSTAEKLANLAAGLAEFAAPPLRQTGPIELGDCVRRATDAIRAALGKGCSLAIDLPDDLPPVVGESAAITDCLVALAASARSAMPNGGRFRLVASVVQVGPDWFDILPPLEPGQYVCLEASDTGAPMPVEWRDRAIEPLTAPAVVGDSADPFGLALPRAYGFLDRIGGGLSLHADSGAGTVVRLYLPVAVAASESEQTLAVLVVSEDRAERRRFAQALREFGLEFLPARYAGEAFALSARSSRPIGALIVPVPLAQVSPRELADEVERAYPGSHTIAISSLSREVLIARGWFDPCWGLLPREWKPAELRAALESPPRSPSSRPASSPSIQLPRTSLAESI